MLLEGQWYLDTRRALGRSRLVPPTLAGHEMEVAPPIPRRPSRYGVARSPAPGLSSLWGRSCSAPRGVLRARHGGLLVAGPPSANRLDPFCGIGAQWLRLAGLAEPMELREPIWCCSFPTSDARSWGRLRGHRPHKSGCLDPGHPPWVPRGASTPPFCPDGPPGSGHPRPAPACARCPASFQKGILWKGTTVSNTEMDYTLRRRL